MPIIRSLFLTCVLLSFSVEVAHSDSADTKPAVVLLHGLARSKSSMNTLEQRLGAEGYVVCNLGYPSAQHEIETLAKNFVLPGIEKCFSKKQQNFNFVTHSMGGIVVREIAKQQSDFPFGRVVMLSPPNQGSEVVDSLGDWWLFQWINGPAGKQLGTAAKSKPNQLGPVSFELGVITGNQSINWILSSILPGDDDGKVTVKRARVQGMKDFLIMPATHPFIMQNSQVITQVIHFLKHGSFVQQ